MATACSAPTSQPAPTRPSPGPRRAGAPPGRPPATTGRGGRPEDGLSCDAVEAEICRLAVDAPLELEPRALARHLRRCTDCDEFVDGLGECRRWLATVSRPLDLAARAGKDRAMLEAQACTALARELRARLARDLLALGRRESPRPIDVRRRDAQRLVMLEGQLPDARAVVLAIRRSAFDRELAFQAAAMLDPTGLDVALALLGSLERSGRRGLAHRLTDRLLCGLT